MRPFLHGFCINNIPELLRDELRCWFFWRRALAKGTKVPIAAMGTRLRLVTRRLGLISTSCCPSCAGGGTSPMESVTYCTALVEVARGCDFKAALQWLTDFTGVNISEPVHQGCNHEPDTTWAADLKWARRWKIAVKTMAEWALEELPYCHPERRGLTSLLNTIRLADAALVNEYREWRRREPLMTSGLCDAGRRAERGCKSGWRGGW
jgi:hypothetical protein